MTAAERLHTEPVDPFTRGTGPGLSEPLQIAVAQAREWAGGNLVALLLSGSHASGEAVWVELDGRRVSLSDLDLYAVLGDEAACRAAAGRARAGREEWRVDGATAGLAAPVEIAFVTLASLARMPARPGTVELVRSARVVLGDGGVMARLPHWEPGQVSAEERLLLLENRAFELLWALSPGKGVLGALRARHAVLKAALELASVRTLAHGELPAGSAARVARARELGAPADLPSWLAGAWSSTGALWDAAIAWRLAGAAALAADAARAEWSAAVRAWCAAWWSESAAGSTAHDPWRRALDTAARAPLARRLRRSLAFGPRAVSPPEWPARLAAAFAGTPEHRIHGSASVLLLAAAQAGGNPTLPAGALQALRRLGVVRPLTFDAAAREAVCAWDRQLHDGQRTAADA